MNGVLCVNKPSGFTSFDVIAKLRGMLHIKRIGHTGTLDPMATGVLPILVGNATKACDMLPDTGKIYRAGFKLGISTDTQDITGKIINQHDESVSSKVCKEAFLSFKGNIKQIPPMFSAVSVNGKRLYELARQGIEIEREARDVCINEISVENFDEKNGEGMVYIDCSKGTYVRTIIYDAGEKLGCGATMTKLVRLASNGFKLENCLTLDEIQTLCEREQIQERLIPTEMLFAYLPKLLLNAEQTRMYKNGVKLSLSQIQCKGDNPKYTVYDNNQEFLGIAIADKSNEILRIEKNFWG